MRVDDEALPDPPPQGPPVPFPWLADGAARRLGVQMGIVPIAGEGQAQSGFLNTYWPIMAGGLVVLAAVLALRR